MRVMVLLLALLLLFSLGTFSPAKADTILFPVIAVNQPNITTIISVWTRPGTSTGYLLYIYRTKCAIVGCGVSGTKTTQEAVQHSFSCNAEYRWLGMV